MKRIILMLGFLSSSVTGGFSSADARELSLSPLSYATVRGSDGGQSAAALSLQDQSGTDDDWNRYVEFNTPGVAYQGTRTWILPGAIDPRGITALRFDVHYKGPLKSFQTWTWKIYDWKNRRWTFLGTNAGASGWQWGMLRFPIGGVLPNYINAARNLKIQLTSNNAADDADIDFEALVFTVPEAQELPDEASRWRPEMNDSFQIQFTGDIDTSIPADIYELDLFDTPTGLIDALHASGRKAICYINTGTWEDWRPDQASFPAGMKGRGNGWPGEKWLDIRQIHVLGPLMEARMDLCRSKGFDGIETDNIDGYTNDTGFPLTYQDQLAYNLFLSQAAHARGLSIGLKNDLGQILDLVGHYDWMLNESCFDYDECGLLTPFVQAGKTVYTLEYDLPLSAVCDEARALGIQAIGKNQNLDAYRETCR